MINPAALPNGRVCFCGYAIKGNDTNTYFSLSFLKETEDRTQGLVGVRFWKNQNQEGTSMAQLAEWGVDKYCVVFAKENVYQGKINYIAEYIKIIPENVYNEQYHLNKKKKEQKQEQEPQEQTFSNTETEYPF